MIGYQNNYQYIDNTQANLRIDVFVVMLLTSFDRCGHAFDCFLTAFDGQNWSYPDHFCRAGRTDFVRQQKSRGPIAMTGPLSRDFARRNGGQVCGVSTGVHREFTF